MTTNRPLTDLTVRFPAPVDKHVDASAAERLFFPSPAAAANTATLPAAHDEEQDEGGPVENTPDASMSVDASEIAEMLERYPFAWLRLHVDMGILVDDLTYPLRVQAIGNGNISVALLATGDELSVGSDITATVKEAQAKLQAWRFQARRTPVIVALSLEVPRERIRVPVEKDGHKVNVDVLPDGNCKVCHGSGMVSEIRAVGSTRKADPARVVCDCVARRCAEAFGQTRPDAPLPSKKPAKKAPRVASTKMLARRSATWKAKHLPATTTRTLRTKLSAKEIEERFAAAKLDAEAKRKARNRRKRGRAS